MDGIIHESRVEYDHPPTHPYYEEAASDNALIALTAIILLVGMVLVAI